MPTGNWMGFPMLQLSASFLLTLHFLFALQMLHDRTSVSLMCCWRPFPHPLSTAITSFQPTSSNTTVMVNALKSLTGASSCCSYPRLASQLSSSLPLHQTLGSSDPFVGCITSKTRLHFPLVWLGNQTQGICIVFWDWTPASIAGKVWRSSSMFYSLFWLFSIFLLNFHIHSP